MNNKDVKPIIVNGELNVGRKKTEYKAPEFKQPKKNPLADLLLTLIGVSLVGFGVYSIINKDDNKKKNVDSNSNITSNEKSNNTEKTIEYSKSFQLGNVESTNVYSAEDIAAMNSSEGLNVSNMSNNAKLALASKIATEVDKNGKKYIQEEEMDICIKSLFGDIQYTKSNFVRGKNTYTYNQETKMYYLMSTDDITLNYTKYDYSTSSEENNVLKVKNYVLYTDNTKSWTLNNVSLQELITKDNMIEKINTLKYYEFTYNKVNGKYYLSNITIK